MFVGPYEVLEAHDSHTYTISKQGQTSTQNECRLKLFRVCECLEGKALASVEAPQMPNSKGRARKSTERFSPVLEPDNSSETKKEASKMADKGLDTLGPRMGVILES